MDLTRLIYVHLFVLIGFGGVGVFFSHSDMASGNPGGFALFFSSILCIMAAGAMTSITATLKAQIGRINELEKRLDDLTKESAQANINPEDDE